MIISVEELKRHVTTDQDQKALEFQLLALESLIRNTTNNTFQNTRVRAKFEAVAQGLKGTLPQIKAGDTIQITQSQYNDGLYVVVSNNEGLVELDKELYPEAAVTATLVAYPDDVKWGTIEIMRWKLQNQDKNNPNNSKQYISSESISRYSVTYATDKTEEDMDESYGVPKKYTAFLKAYRKPRF